MLEFKRLREGISLYLEVLFMVKLVFFDLDDCMVESSPLIQASFDLKTKFKNDKLLSLEYVLASCKESYERNKIEIERACAANEKPKLIGNVKIGSNDIIKTTSENRALDDLEKEKRRIIRWYKKPLELSQKAYGDAYWAKEMFLEERDHFLEMDNQKSSENAIVDYSSIYNQDHLTNNAIPMMIEIIESGKYDNCFCLSHHNGGREEVCKREFVRTTFGDRLQFLGLRFHSEEYKEGVRRPRSSKALYVMQKFNLPNLEGCILLDDSTANLDEWVKYGGIAILYRPISEDEEYEGELVPHGNDYPRITQMDYNQFEEALNFYKAKVFTK